MEALNVNTNNVNENIKEMNMIQKIIGVITNPAETMKSAAAKPQILVPMLIIAVVPLLLVLLQYNLYVDFMKYVTEMTLASNPQAAQLTQEQIQASVNFNAKIAVFITPFGALFGWFMGTLILWGIMKIFKGEGTLKQYLSMTGFASVIMAVYYLLSLGLSYVTGNLYLNSSLALLVPDMKGELAYGILRGIDFFTVWHYAVIAIGVCALSKVSKAKVYPVVGLIFLASVLMGIGSFKFM